MILVHCLKCTYHDEATIDGEAVSRCRKENCLSMYSDCVADAAMSQFIEDNRVPVLEPRATALELCYPII
jgi:hypothetical protein